jgi:hypothetical protein
LGRGVEVMMFREADHNGIPMSGPIAQRMDQVTSRYGWKPHRHRCLFVV